MHFWTWRKQQQKLQANAKKYQEAAENSAESLQDSLTPEIASPNSNNTNSNANSNSAPKRAYPTSNGTFKDVKARQKLMEVGGRVEEMLRDPQTPNETKLKGFAQVLLDEWSKGTFFYLFNAFFSFFKGYLMLYLNYLKVRKSQKQFFLKLHCPKSKRNF